VKWFDAHVDEEDRFLPPNFDLGQFFFSKRTAGELVERLDRYRSPCCVCTPRLAWEWGQRGRSVRLLELDARFATLPGFRRFDLLSPAAMDEAYDMIIVDPIFISAFTLRRALDRVAGASVVDELALFVIFPVEREKELRTAFDRFQLHRLPFTLKHNNVKSSAQDRFALYGNRDIQ
jgi:hypothetical protein